VLASGDTVEIFTSKVEGAGPSRDWLRFVATNRAAAKIKQWYLREQREDARETGADELIRALRRDGLPVQKIRQSGVLDTVASAMNYADLDALHAAIGHNHVSAAAVAERVRRHLHHGDPETQDRLPLTVRQATPLRRSLDTRGTSGVHVEGLDDVMVRLSRCCTPVPGDPIMGFVTRGRGVSVHRSDCANGVSLASSQAERVIEVDWDEAPAGTFVASVEVKALDRSRLLRDVSAALADAHVNIISCTTVTGSDRISTMQFDFELGDPAHLEWLLRSIRQIDSIYDAYRVMPRA
jgi:GTP pyrophosphokinase